MKILLIDPVGTGHHQEYSTLLAEGLKTLGMQVYFFGSKPLVDSLISANLLEDGFPHAEMNVGRNFLKNEQMRVHFFQEAMLVSRRIAPDIVHFLYMDHFLISAVCSGLMAKRVGAVCATLHAIYFLPEFAPSFIYRMKGNIDFMMLRTLASQGMRIMAHSERVSNSLTKLTGMKQFDYIPYPVKSYMTDSDDKGMLRSKLRERLRLASMDVLLLVFGGTRRDKGADLAVKMLSLLPTRYHLLFAGKDTYFSRAFLTGLASKLALNDRIHFDNRFIPEKDVPAYFYGCDIVLIPYRKTFSGQSGPLTIAATLGVKIVAPDLTAFEETLSKYDLGCLYPVENLALMADAVEKVEKLPPPAGFEKFRMEHGGPVFTGRVFESYNKTLHQ